MRDRGLRQPGRRRRATAHGRTLPTDEHIRMAPLNVLIGPPKDVNRVPAAWSMSLCSLAGLPLPAPRTRAPQGSSAALAPSTMSPAPAGANLFRRFFGLGRLRAAAWGPPAGARQALPCPMQLRPACAAAVSLATAAAAMRALALSPDRVHTAHAHSLPPPPTPRLQSRTSRCTSWSASHAASRSTRPSATS